MLGALRGVFGGALRPVAWLLLRLGLSPSAVTVLGTLGVVASALAFLPAGRWVLGPSLMAVFLLGDGLDGSMARASGRESRFGAFLDSTMDRLADGAVFVALAWGCARVGDGVGAGLSLATLVAGFMVSYARARAEAEGWDAAVGVFERPDRLVVTLVGVVAVGLGAPRWVLWVALGAVAIGSTVTVAQRVAAAHRASAAS
ncbi:MAG: phosphatidylinositol phosphate synthase [Arachnia sp.]